MVFEQRKKEPPKILIVDDLSVNVKILENIMQAEGYEALCALNVQEALDIMNETMPQLILSDFSMPGMDGLEFCRLLKSNPRTREIPFVFITVADSREEKKEAFQAGAVDFIPKPFEPTEVVMRVNNQLNSYRIKQEMEDYNRMMHRMVEDQKRQIEKEMEHVLKALSRIVEKRNAHSGSHLKTVGENCHLLAQSLQFIPEYEDRITDEFIETIGVAAMLHDIGSLVLPDSVLIQEDSSEEKCREVMRLRAEEGVKILEDISGGTNNSHFLDMAISIVRYYHANWDGTGYPERVKGEEIPLAARITRIVNDFEALAGGKNNQEGCPVEACIQKINEGSGTAYAPRIVEVFNKILKQLRTD